MTGGRARISLAVWSALVIAFLWIPLVIIALYAFNSSTLQGWPITSWTFHWFSIAWHNQEARDAFRLSVKVALVATGTALVLGTMAVTHEGTDATIIACGVQVADANRAARRLADDGIKVRVLYCHTVKPLDTVAVLAAARDTRAIVTVEDHTTIGGLGGAVAETLAELAPTPLKRLGVTGFGESGDPKGLYAKHGLDPAGIAASVKKFLNR